MARELHLNLFIHGRGHHEAGWRHPGASRRPMTDIGYYVELARKAEAGLFDSIFLADQLILGDDAGHVAKGGLEPITTLAALAMATTRIGMIATCSTTYTEPFNLARQFASLDHISGGRIGWNIVTSWAPGAERNYSRSRQPSHEERYAAAEEYMQVVLGLWNSWADDALVDDPASGQFARTGRIRRLDHRSTHYAVEGPLNVSRPPQGWPVLVQAGSSDTGRRFAAGHAEAVFTAQLDRDTSAAFAADLKAQAAAMGRDPSQLLVLPGLSPVIGATEAEARRLKQELDALADPEVGRKRLSGRFGGHDFSHLPLDRPLTVADFPDPDTVQAARSRTQVILSMVERDAPTLRQLLQRLSGARGHYTMAGTPEQVADLIEDWHRAGAADGFNLMPPVLPAMLDAFVDGVVPILQRRGLFRRAYAGTTLRAHYGLQRPGDGFAPRIAAALAAD